MQPEFGLLLAFATGLTGAFHCLGMCGSFAGGYFIGHGRGLLPQIGYHGARILTYVVLGTTGALIGRVVAQNGIVGKGQGLLMILAGLLILLLGIGLTGLVPGLMRPRRCPRGGCPVVQFGRQPRVSRLLPLVAGLFNGLVPCSLVFSVAIKAAATGEPLQAGLLMLVFGAGTLPAMALATTAGALVGEPGLRRARRLTGVTVMLLGSWTLYQGITFHHIMSGLAG